MQNMTVYLVNCSMKLSLSILLLFLTGICFSQEGYLRGTVLDDNGKEMSFVSVFQEETGLITFTDSSGFYELKLSEGIHTVVFSYLGYTSQAKSVNVKNSVVFLNLALAKSTVELQNAEVVADTRDRAREIMKKVRNARSGISDFTEDFRLSLTYPRGHPHERNSSNLTPPPRSPTQEIAPPPRLQNSQWTISPHTISWAPHGLLQSPINS